MKCSISSPEELQNNTEGWGCCQTHKKFPIRDIHDKISLIGGIPCKEKKLKESKMFYQFSLEDVVPGDHPVRLIENVLDLSFLYDMTKPYYSREGKPSIDPVVLFKFYIIGYFFGVNSERKLFQEIRVNMAYRWFIGYDIDEPIPHHSIMTKSRYRFPKSVFSSLFLRIISLCRDANLISGDYFFLDSSAIKANASRDSFHQKLQTEEQYLNCLDEIEPQDISKSCYGFDGSVDPNKMGRRRETPKKSETYISITDPDAQMITRPGKGTFPAFKAHICVDRKKRIVLSVFGSRTTDDDMSKIDELFTSSIFITNKKTTLCSG